MNCPKCGIPVEGSMKFCPNCAAKLVIAEPAAPKAAPMAAPAAEPAKPKSKKAFGIISLILGILSVLSSLFAIFSLPASIVGLILGKRYEEAGGLKKAGKILNVAGLVLSIVSIVLTVAIIIVSVVYFSPEKFKGEGYELVTDYYTEWSEETMPDGKTVGIHYADTELWVIPCESGALSHVLPGFDTVSDAAGFDTYYWDSELDEMADHYWQIYNALEEQGGDYASETVYFSRLDGGIYYGTIDVYNGNDYDWEEYYIVFAPEYNGIAVFKAVSYDGEEHDYLVESLLRDIVFEDQTSLLKDSGASQDHAHDAPAADTTYYY